MDNKIFIFAEYYKPGYLAGGPVQSVYNMCMLNSDYSFYIYTQNFDIGKQAFPYQVQNNTWLKAGYAKLYYTGKSSYRLSSWRQLFIVKPDVIYFNSLFATATQFNIFQAVFYSFFHKCKIIIAPRGELDEGALSIKAKKKALYINIFKLFGSSKIVLHATTEKEKVFIAKKLKNKTIVAENIPLVLDNPIDKIKDASSSNFIFISRICYKKNLLFALQCLQKVKIEGILYFTIIGPFEDKGYWEQCETLIESMPLNIKCFVLGPIPHADISKKLKANHYLLFPTIAENFGHIIYESLINSLPVIISDNTPWDNGYENGVFAYPLNDDGPFIKQIEKLHALNQYDYNIMSKNAFEYAKNKVNFTHIKKQYHNLFN